MKVLMLNYEFPPLGGGAANATYYILKNFSEVKGIEFDLVTSSADKYRAEKLFNNVIVHRLDIGKNGNLHYQSIKELLTYSMKALKYSKMLNKKKKYDLVHAFFGIPCGYIAMKLKLPYIVSLRGSDVPFYNKRFEKLDKIVFKRLSRRIWKKAKAVVANSQGLKKLALSSAPGQKIGVIYNGVDVSEVKEESHNKNDNKINIISTGRLIPRKGYEYLIEALSGLESFSLKLIGEGNSFEELEELAKKKNVNVDFSGRVEHERIYKYLNQADLFVLPSLNEGMSNSMLEAMACRLPVIGTDVGGSKELIDGNGFIVEKGNSAELRRALLSYKRDRTLIKKHGDKSKKLAEKLTWENVVRDYFTIYNKIEFT